MEVVPYCQIEPDMWDALVLASDDTWIYHHSVWIKLVEQYWGMQNVSFGVYVNNQLICIFPLYIFRTRNKRKALCSGAVRTGPAFLDDQKHINKSRLLKFLWTYIQELATTENCHRIYFRLPPLAPRFIQKPQSVPFFVDWGFSSTLSYHTLPFIPTPAVDQIIELQQDDSDIFRGFNEHCRRKIRKADTNGFNIRFENTEKAVEEFYSVYKITLDRTEATAQPLEFYLELLKHFPDHVLICLAEKDKIVIASLFILLYKSAATYYAGGTLTDHIGSGVGHYIQYKAMLYLREIGQHYYEIGPHFPSLESIGNKMYKIGLFKRQFGGRSILLPEGEYILDLKNYKTQIMLSILKRIFEWPARKLLSYSLMKGVRKS